MIEIERRDFILGGLSIVGLMFISALKYDVETLKQQLKEEKTEDTYRDMELLRLTNEARERVGLSSINSGLAGYTCEEVQE